MSLQTWCKLAWVVACFVHTFLSRSLAILPASGRLYMPLTILTYTHPSSSMLFKFYLSVISCGMVLIGSCMYCARAIVVPGKKFDRLIVKNLAPGIDITELYSILIVGKSQFKVLTSYRHTSLSPLTTRRDLFFYFFCGLYDTTIFP